MKTNKIILGVAACAALILGAPAAAQAAVVSTYSDGSISVVDTAGQTNELAVEMPAPDQYRLQDPAGLTLDFEQAEVVDCTQDNPDRVTCTAAVSDLFFRVSLGDGDDTLGMDVDHRNGDWPDAWVMGGNGSDTIVSTGTSRDVVWGGNFQYDSDLFGDDVVSGGPGDDELSGERGDDRLDGGEGNDGVGGDVGGDSLVGGAGDDTLHEYGPEANDLMGGDGDDLLLPGDGDDLVDGGAGRDSATFYTAVGVNVTLDGEANDGAPGQNANVHAENLYGTSSKDVLVGDDGPNMLSGYGEFGESGTDRIDGAGGADELYSSDGVLTGGAGDDLIDQGSGEGDGGPGNDRIFLSDEGSVVGGTGSDDIGVENSVFNEVDCGSEFDTVTAVLIDSVLGDCEIVGRDNPGGGNPGGGSPGGGGVGNPGVGAPSAGGNPSGAAVPRSPALELRTLSVRPARLEAALRRGLAVRTSCSTGAQLSASLSVDKRTARNAGLGRKAVKVASRKGSCTPQGTTLQLRFTTNARHRLAKLAGVKLRLIATASSAGKRDTATKTLTLKR